MNTPIGDLEGSPINITKILQIMNTIVSKQLQFCEVLPSDVRHPMELLLRNY